MKTSTFICRIRPDKPSGQLLWGIAKRYSIVCNLRHINEINKRTRTWIHGKRVHKYVRRVTDHVYELTGPADTMARVIHDGILPITSDPDAIVQWDGSVYVHWQGKGAGEKPKLKLTLPQATYRKALENADKTAAQLPLVRDGVRILRGLKHIRTQAQQLQQEREKIENLISQIPKGVFRLVVAQIAEDKQAHQGGEHGRHHGRAGGGDIGLYRVSQGVNAGTGGEVRAQGQGGFRVHQGDIRHHTLADMAIF